MVTVMTNLKISQDKVQLAMARKTMNPYDLCSKAGICKTAHYGWVWRQIKADSFPLFPSDYV